MKYSKRSLVSAISDILIGFGVLESDALVTAQVLVAAEMRNIPSHGLLRLPDYIHLIKNGRINPCANPRIIHQTPSTATYDGDAGLGPAVANSAMDLAIKKAGEVGTAWVAVSNSNHFGIAGYFALKAIPHDMIGICMTNANPLVAPTFSAKGLLGTNPIAVAIPANKENPLVADFATASIARGKVDLLDRKGASIPEGFVQQEGGLPSTDPGVLKRGGAILPLGSTREYGSHKGFCLAAVVDIFSALLSGANYGPFVPPSVAYLPLQANLPGKGTGHFVGAMRIDAFQPAEQFKNEMDAWIQTFRNAPSAKGQEKIIIPGDPERESEDKNTITGVEISEKVLEQIRLLCQEAKLQSPF